MVTVWLIFLSRYNDLRKKIDENPNEKLSSSIINPVLVVLFAKLVSFPFTAAMFSAFPLFAVL